MPAIPPTSDFNKSTIDKDTFHAKFLAVHAYLTGLLGSDGLPSTALGSLGVSSFIKTLLDDADAATARGTLGLPALLNQNYGSDGVTKIITNTTAGVDFNTHTSAGVYNFDATSSANAPVTGLVWIFLEVFRHGNLAAGSEYTIQIAHDMNSGSRARSWTRRQVAGSWSAWVETTSGAQSLAADGYKMLPGGLILQWGAQTVAASTTSTYSFPLAFPNACMQFVAGTSIDGPAGANRNDSTGGVHISASQYQLRQGSASGGITIRWIAVGY